MGDQFAITVNTGELSAAETALGNLGNAIDDEGGKLRSLPGKAASWTGTTATTLKAEMTRVGDQMAKSTPHFSTAKQAVATFRQALEDAQQKTIPDLNRRWNDTITSYDSAVSSATRSYGNTVREHRNMPPEDTASSRKAAATTRDAAISDAAAVRDGAQKKLQGEFDALLTELRSAAKTCGAALSAAVLAAVPAEIVSKYLAGGGMGLGKLDREFDKLTAPTRQALTGDQSLTGQSDDYRAGEELAAPIKDKLKKGEALTPDEIAALKANGKNEAFVKGLLVALGPSAVAALGADQIRFGQGYDEDDKKLAADYKSFLTDILATGSHIKVDDGNGHLRYLMDAAWLDKYNPKASWSEDDLRHIGYGEDGYRPNFLLPFLTGKLSENFTDVISERWMKDYEASGKQAGGGASTWFPTAYRDADGNDLSHIVFDRIREHPSVSNKVLMGHFDTMMHIMTGKDPMLTGGSGQKDVLGASLNEILKQGTLGLPADQQFLADSVVSRLGSWFADPKHKKDVLISDVRPALGQILTDDRYLTGQIASVSTPFGPAMGGYDPITGAVRDPRFGLLMPKEVWAELQQQALRSPENVVALTTATQKWFDEARSNSSGTAFTYESDQLDGNFMPGRDSHGNVESSSADWSVVGLDYFEQETVYGFLGNNINTVRGDLETQLADELEKRGKSRDLAKGAVGKIIGWASDPTAAPRDIATATVGATVDWIVDETGKRGDAAVKKEGEAVMKKLEDAAGTYNERTPVSDYSEAASNLAENYREGGTPSSKYTQRDPDPNAPMGHFTGNPKEYVGKKSETHYVGGGGNPVVTITDDFLTYENGPNSKVTGIVKPSEMNELQREAYNRWLHDPAVQSHLSQNNDAIKGAVEDAERQNAGK